MAITRKQKEVILAELKKYFEGAKTIVFSHYKGVLVKDMRTLRKKLHEQKVHLQIAKKTLITRASKEAGFDSIPETFMDGPIALAFGMEDEIAPAKIIHEFGKEHSTVKITGALFERKFISVSEAQVIATLPSREVLLAEFVSLLKSPIARFHSVLHSLLRNFVYVMSQVHYKKSTTLS